MRLSGCLIERPEDLIIKPSDAHRRPRGRTVGCDVTWPFCYATEGPCETVLLCMSRKCACFASPNFPLLCLEPLILMWTPAPDSPFPANCENTFNPTPAGTPPPPPPRIPESAGVCIVFSAGCTIGLAVLYPSEWNSMNIWSSVGTLATPPTGIYAGDAPLPSCQPQIPPLTDRTFPTIPFCFSSATLNFLTLDDS